MTPNQLQEEDKSAVGDIVALLVGSFDPPTMDYQRAVEALKARPEIKHVWLCPISGAADEHVKAMGQMLAIHMSSSASRCSYCTISLDMKMDAVKTMEWVRARFPYFNFRFASLAPDFHPDTQQSFQVHLGSAGLVPEGATPVVADKFVAAPGDMKIRIGASLDESRHFAIPVWNYIKKNGLYAGEKKDG